MTMSETAMKTLTCWDQIPKDMHIRLLRTMLLIRRFEESIVDVYPAQDMKTPVHLYIGQEAIAAGACAHLTPEDYVFTNHRNHGHCLAKGMDPKMLYAELYGRTTGCCKGKGGSMHPAAPEIGIPGTSAIVGGGLPLGVGAALAFKMTGTDRISVVFFGDGAADEGVFHESMNFASLKKLPVVFVCENNLYATNSPLSARQPHDRIAERAEGYDMPGASLDGSDVTGIYSAAGKAAAQARAGGGPTLIECKTYRWKGHVGPECDVEKGCRPRAELEAWMEKCPLVLYKNRLFDENLVDEDQYQRLCDEIDRQLASDLALAKQSPYPDEKDLLSDVYFDRN